MSDEKTSIKVQIVKKLIERPHTTAELLVHLFGEGNKKAFNRIDKPLRDLKELNVITQEKDISVSCPGAKPTLNKISPVFFHIPGYDMSKAPDTIDIFKIGLKYSPALLDDMINKKLTKESIGQVINTKIISTLSLLHCGAWLQRMCMVEKAKKANFRHRYLCAGTESKINNRFESMKKYMQDNPLPYVINDYIAVSLASGHISEDIAASDEFTEDILKLTRLTYGELAGEDVIDNVIMGLVG